jgi:hypothetical protein
VSWESSRAQFELNWVINTDYFEWMNIFNRLTLTNYFLSQFQL